LEKLVPEKEENTSLEDRPDPAAGEAPASKRRGRRRRRRERGCGGGRTAKVASSPRAPFLYGLTAGPDYPAQTWTGYSGPRIIRPRSGPDNPAWNSFCSGNLWQKTELVCMERMFIDEMGLG
jgi:hypothetical protein